MYTVGQYIIDRLNQIGIKHLFGVPGDYNLEFLNTVLKSDKIEWIANTNELNASYAADGYARINGISALLTTYGVGELSAINGIAGSYAEDIPIIHIVGVPNSDVVINNRIIHHGLGKNNFDVFKQMFEHVSVYQIWLNNKNVEKQIDEAIKHAIFYKKPVYVMLPSDIVNLAANTADNNLTFDFSINEKNLEFAINSLNQKIIKSHKACIICGHKILSYGLKHVVEDFVNKTNINVVNSLFGKGSINEENNNYIGTYYGDKTYDYSLKTFINECDLIITIGLKFTDLSSSNFNLGFNHKNIFEINDTYIRFDNKTLSQISMGAFLKAYLKNYVEYEGEKANIKIQKPYFVASDSKLSLDDFFECVNSFIKGNDIIVSDIGTSFFGTQFLNLKQNTDYISQPLWASIGFSFPAALGAKLAHKSKRVLNFIGDGAFNMSLNEIGCAINNQIGIVVFVLNNKGYTIERLICKNDASYNNTPYISYCELVKAFSDNQNKYETFKVETEKELLDCFNKLEYIDNKFVLVEIVLEQNDVPIQMRKYFQ